MADQKMKHVETTTLHRVPDEQRLNWVTIALIQAGIMICVPSLLLGGLLAEGMDFKSALIAGGLGYGLAVLITTIMGIQGYDLGVPSCVVATSSFGEKGSRILLSALYAVSLIGWFALQTNVCGSAFSNLLNATFGISVPIWVSTVFWGIVMLITAVYGIKALDKLNSFAVPALILVCFYGMYLAIRQFGLDALSGGPENTMTIIGAAELTLSFGAVGMVLAPDFTRYQKSRKDTIKSTVFGILPAGLLMLLMGYIMSKVSGNFDLTMVMADIGIPLLGLITLVLATWTTNTTNSYSAGIDIVMLFNLKDDKRAMATLAAGIMGTLLAVVGAINYFESFLYWVGYTFTPVAGVVMADYWIIRKGNPRNWVPVEGIGWLAIISWLIGVFVTTKITVGFPILTGMLTSMVLYTVLNKIFLKPSVASDMVTEKHI